MPYRSLGLPPTCPICGAPYTTCTTFHPAGSLPGVPISMPRLLRLQRAQRAAPPPEPVATIVSPPFTTASYVRALHRPKRKSKPA